MHQRTRVFQKTVLVIVTLLTMLAGLYYLAARVVIRNSLKRAAAIELSLHYERWKERGRPFAEELSVFMAGRNSNIVVSNRPLHVGGMQTLSQFAHTNWSGMGMKDGTLFVTTNGEVVLENGRGRMKLIRN